MNILQQLRHQFTRGGRIRLHIDKHSIIDELFASAMMIHDYDLLRLLQQLRFCDHGCFMRINDDDKRVAESIDLTPAPV